MLSSTKSNSIKHKKEITQTDVQQTNATQTIMSNLSIVSHSTENQPNTENQTDTKNQTEIQIKDTPTNRGLSKLNLEVFSNLDKLPEDLIISTMTITCSMNTLFNIINIGKYIDLSESAIVSVKYGNKLSGIRALAIGKQKKYKTNRVKKSKRAFFNQVSIKIKSKYGNNPNVKLFKNGSIQLTGCKGEKHFIELLEIVCRELLKVKAIVDPKTMNTVVVKPFVTNRNNIDISKITNINIRMINSNYNIGFRIDREKLYSLLLKKNIDCSFEPCVHACVNIKHNYKNVEKISIFVFESGSIIITGAKTWDHINSAYTFITTTLYENYSKIYLHNLEQLIKRNNIENILEISESQTN